jgi:DNA adenine methylase Dam
MNKELIKGPFSYSGNKFRIYNNYLSDVLSKFEMVHEPFIGSGVCLYNSNKGGQGIDIDPNVVSLHNSLLDDNLLEKMEETYKKYFQNGRNKESYMSLRNDFNKSYVKVGTSNENVHMLHLLLQLSFNSLLRFSKNGYNVPFGMKEVDFKRIEDHQKIVKTKDIHIICGKYSDLDLSKIDKKKDVIYLDPPYIASKFKYGGWEKKDEKLLLDYIDKLNNDGYKFILSNTFSHRNQINQTLIDWSVKYNVKNIIMSYNSWAASVSTVSVEKNTNEVIISNF